MVNKSNKGQISIFLCIILMGMLMLAAVLTEASRTAAGEVMVKRAVRNAARSVLAEYSTKLRSDYGLFALSPGKCTSSEDELERYIMLNLEGPEAADTLKLYDFRVEDIKIEPIFELTGNQVFKKQVLEYMKYRAPKELAEGFIDRLRLFNEMSKISEAYNKKIAMDKLSGKMDKIQQQLKRSLDGSQESEAADENCVNGFNMADSWRTKFNKLLELYNNIKGSTAEKAVTDSMISDLDQQILKLKETKQDRLIDELLEKKKKLMSQKNELEAIISELRTNITGISNELQSKMTRPYISKNESAINSVLEIVVMGEKISSAVNELEDFIKNNFGLSDSHVSSFLDTVAQDIKLTKELLLSGAKAEQMVEQLRRNVDVLKELHAEIQAVSGIISDSIQHSRFDQADMAALEQAAQKIINLLAEYDNNITYSYAKPEKGDAADDPRKGKAEEVKEFLESKLLKDRNYLTSGFKKEDMPSANKTTASSSEANNSLDLIDNAGSRIDLYNEDEQFQENTFSFVSSMLSGLMENMTALRDNIYINEYIMGTFKCAAPGLKSGTTLNEDLDLRAKSKKARDTFYDCEVEYILHGRPSENANRALTTGQLLLLRFALNTLHVYTDAAKKELAAATATALCGWWTGGAGIPVVSNLIMAGWGLGEAIIDVKDLLEGEKVPIYKSKGDWKLDIGLKKEGIKTDAALTFSYFDYMRLFLLTMDEDKKLGRVQDLIQINLNLNKPEMGEINRLSGFNAYIRVEALVSMKYLFGVHSLVPSSNKTSDGRHLFRVLVYEGY